MTISATGVLAQTWRALRERPGIWVFALWYLFTSALFNWAFLSRLGPELPSWVLHPTSQTITGGNLSFLHGPLLVQVILVYLTFLLIVTPILLGGLYGGAAFLLKSRPTAGFLEFWRHAYRNFFPALALVVLLVLVIALATAVVMLLGLLVGGISGGSVLIGGLYDIVVLAFVALLMTVVLYWTGAVFSGGIPAHRALWRAVRWAWSHWWFALRLAVLMLATVVVIMLAIAFSGAVPGLGAVVALVLGAGVLSFLATLANLVYLDSAPVA